jgi:hypothetical protein
VTGSQDLDSTTAAMRYPIVQPPEHDELFLPDHVDPDALVRTCLCGQEFASDTAKKAQRLLWDHVDAAS